MKNIITVLLLLTFLPTVAQDNAIIKEKFHFNNPENQNSSSGYAQVVKVDNVLYISGTVARELTPEGIKQVYTTLEQSLKAFGAGFQNVVKENLFTTDIETMKKFNDVRKGFYKGDFPAATWVQISRLFTEDSKLEVELIAHLPK